MATSPRNELKIVTITDFREGPPGVWRWSRRLPSGEIDTSTAGAGSLDEAIRDFFARVHYDPAIEDVTLKHFSKPYQANPQLWHIREYAWGAPEPYVE